MLTNVVPFLLNIVMVLRFINIFGIRENILLSLVDADYNVPSPGILCHYSTQAHDPTIENGFPSLWQSICTRWRPEYKLDTTPPPGVAHWPAI